EHDGLVAVERDAATDVDRCVGSPARGEDAAHRLAWSPDPWELGEVDVDGLVCGAARDLGDGEGLRSAEKVHGVELIGVGREGLADVEGHVRPPGGRS